VKPFHEFGFKDERNRGMEEFTGINHQKESYYQYTEQFQFDDSVPENVREIWSLALDLFNHIHFNFEFSEPSNLYVLMTVESALIEVMKNEIPDLKRETMGKVVRRFIKKYSRILTEDDKKWLEILVLMRNSRAHLRNKMYGPPFGMSLIRPSFNFICGLFYNPIMILTSKSPFVIRMDRLMEMINDYPYVFYKRRFREYDKNGLFDLGY
jgi:hypothetical protein